MIESIFETIQTLGQHRTLIAVCVPVGGAALAAASSLLTPRGMAKGLITGAYMLLTGLGVGCLLLVFLGIAVGVPRNMVLPLVVPGIALTAVMGVFTPEVVREYQGFEARRLIAEIFRRS